MGVSGYFCSEEAVFVGSLDFAFNPRSVFRLMDFVRDGVVHAL